MRSRREFLSDGHLKTKETRWLSHPRRATTVPESVPTPRTRVSTIVSKVIVGPIMAMPFAMLFLTSSLLDALSANCASRPVFDRSINSRKKNNASLEFQIQVILLAGRFVTYFSSLTSILSTFSTVDVKTKLENTVKRPAIPKKT